MVDDSEVAVICLTLVPVVFNRARLSPIRQSVAEYVESPFHCSAAAGAAGTAACTRATSSPSKRELSHSRLRPGCGPGPATRNFGAALVLWFGGLPGHRRLMVMVVE